MAEILPAHTIEGFVRGVFRAPDTFVTTPVEVLTLSYAGIPGDVHSGLYRQSGAREPWYPRGTPMRNERQLSILSVEELAEVAVALAIPRLEPEWIGGNLVIEGVPQLSLLPPRSILMFPSGAAIRIDGDNGPCRHSGRSIADPCPAAPISNSASSRRPGTSAASSAGSSARARCGQGTRSASASGSRSSTPAERPVLAERPVPAEPSPRG